MLMPYWTSLARHATRIRVSSNPPWHRLARPILQRQPLSLSAVPPLLHQLAAIGPTTWLWFLGCLVWVVVGLILGPRETLKRQYPLLLGYNRLVISFAMAVGMPIIWSGSIGVWRLLMKSPSSTGTYNYSTSNPPAPPPAFAGRTAGLR
jgi:hypothetical protein